jgi:hypothetical protein
MEGNEREGERERERERERWANNCHTYFGGDGKFELSLREEAAFSSRISVGKTSRRDHKGIPKVFSVFPPTYIKAVSSSLKPFELDEMKMKRDQMERERERKLGRESWLCWRRVWAFESTFGLMHRHQ